MQYINFTGTKYSLTGMISSVKKEEPKVFYKVGKYNGIEKILWRGHSFAYDNDLEWLNLSPSTIDATYYENEPTITNLKEVEYKDVCEVLSWGQGAFYKHKETKQISKIYLSGENTLNEYSRKMAIYRDNAEAWYINENCYEGENI